MVTQRMAQANTPCVTGLHTELISSTVNSPKTVLHIRGCGLSLPQSVSPRFVGSQQATKGFQQQKLFIRAHSLFNCKREMEQREVSYKGLWRLWGVAEGSPDVTRLKVN